MIFFDQIDVTVNGTGILAENASVSVQADLVPAYVIGRRGIVDQAPSQGINNSVSLSYFLEVDNEPNYGIVDQIRNFSSTTEELQPTTINIGGISGVFYLRSYQLKVAPNTPAKVTASYVGYNQVSGNVAEKAGTVNYNASNGSGIGFGFASVGGNHTLKEAFDFNYSFQANYIPVFALGSQEPISVKLMGASEDMSISKTGFYDPSFTGTNPDGTLFNQNGSTGVQIFGLKLFCEDDSSQSVDINVSGTKVKSTSVGHSVNEISRSTTTFSKYF